jgi:hypothetical protein
MKMETFQTGTGEPKAKKSPRRDPAVFQRGPAMSGMTGVMVRPCFTWTLMAVVA